jgi:hypothetical protein
MPSIWSQLRPMHGLSAPSVIRSPTTTTATSALSATRAARAASAPSSKATLSAPIRASMPSRGVVSLNSSIADEPPPSRIAWASGPIRASLSIRPACSGRMPPSFSSRTMPRCSISAAASS